MLALGGPAIHHRLLVEVTGGRRPHRRRRRSFLLAGGLAASLVLALVAEIVTGQVISHRISAAASKRLTGPVSVSIGATPALADLITGHISAVTIHAPSTTICRLRSVDAQATLSDVHRSNGRIAIQGASADMVITAQALAGLLPGSFGPATVTADPAAGILRIGAGPGGLLQVQETAQLRGDTIQLSPAAISLNGRLVPGSLQDMITSRLTIRRTLSGLPLNLTPRSLAITSSGVRVSLASGPAIVSGAPSAPDCATP